MADSGDAHVRKTVGFCLADYATLLRDLLGLGYRAVDLDELVPDERTMFVRHDVDLSLASAAAVAEAEAALGVRATYYLLVSTDMYNIASADARGAVHAIRDLGHAIGLHFDATRYEGNRASLEAGAREECDLLEMIAGAPVASISFHRPAPELMGLEGFFAGRRHCYEPRFFHDLGYISDSSGGFFRGHPLDHPSVMEGKAIQLLTHPIWWASAAPCSADQALSALREERHGAIDDTLSLATAKAPAGFVFSYPRRHSAQRSHI